VCREFRAIQTVLILSSKTKDRISINCFLDVRTNPQSLYGLHNRKRLVNLVESVVKMQRKAEVAVTSTSAWTSHGSIFPASDPLPSGEVYDGFKRSNEVFGDSEHMTLRMGK